MKKNKVLLPLIGAVAIVSFTTALIISSFASPISFTRGGTGADGSVEFTREGAIKQLGTNKYSIEGTTRDGAKMYLISVSESDIASTNYVASFTSGSPSYYVSFAYDANGTSPVRFQAAKKITLATSETDNRTYNVYYNSADGVNFESEHKSVDIGENPVTTTFETDYNYLKITSASTSPTNLTSIKIDYYCSYNADDILATQTDKDNAIREVSEAFDVLDLEDYSAPKRQKIIDKLNETLDAIRNAVYLADIQVATRNCINYFNSQVRAKDVVAGTWFDKKSAESNYEFDRDEENNLVISYAGYPGNWVYVGTSSLVVDITVNNTATVKFRNDSDNTIQYNIQFTGANSYKVETHTKTLAARAIATETLTFKSNIDHFYFFLDSCSEHNRSGQITVLETSLGFEEVDLQDTKKVDINAVMSVGDGSLTGYQLTAEDNPAYIKRVDALFQADFNGNGDSKKWFGVHLYAGGKHVSISDSQVHAQETTIDDTKGINAYTNMPIDQDSKLNVGDTVYMDVSYSAEGIEFKVISYTFFYSKNENETSETVDVNMVTWLDEDHDSHADDSYPVSIPYSSFTKTGTPIRMDINFTTINEASYGKSQLYIRGFNYTSFTSGNNNVLNIGAQMDKSNPNEVQGMVTIYPVEKIDLTEDAQIEFECWWASATMIRIDSVTMYTESLEKPAAVTGLEAHPIDSGMVLNWVKSEYASSYDVYVNTTKVNNVVATYATIDGLNNGQEYDFKVIAKNFVGESEPTVIKATPVEGATYDTFIEGLNTSLEEQIGSANMAGFLAAGDAYSESANNNRLKKVINKMQNGEKTTVAFIGGSVTVGETASLRDERNHAKGYAYYTYQWLKRNYDVQNKSEFVNGAISGTGSEIGIVRAQKDILDHEPDLVFIEYAANNGSSNFYQTSYESLIRKCMELENDPAIVLVFACTTYTKNGSEGTYMSGIGNYYHLPMFSMQKAMETVCSVFDKARTDPVFHNFSDDGTHPNDNGHQLMAKGLCYTLRNAINKATDDKNTYPASPSASGNDKFQNLVPVDNTNSDGVVTDLGSFVATNTATPSTSQQSDVTAFQQGWKKTDTSTNAPMTIDVNAKNFILIYEAGNPSVSGDPTGNIVVTYTNKADSTDTGTLTWDVSKTCKQDSGNITTITPSGNGWQNPVGILIFDKITAANYTITIQMETSAGICTIMAFGYTA